MCHWTTEFFYRLCAWVQSIPLPLILKKSTAMYSVTMAELNQTTRKMNSLVFSLFNKFVALRYALPHCVPFHSTILLKRWRDNWYNFLLICVSCMCGLNKLSLIQCYCEEGNIINMHGAILQLYWILPKMMIIIL